MSEEKIRRIEYRCGCWYLFDVMDPAHWKLLDFVICDRHVEEVLKEGKE